MALSLSLFAARACESHLPLDAPELCLTSEVAVPFISPRNTGEARSTKRERASEELSGGLSRLHSCWGGSHSKACKATLLSRDKALDLGRVHCRFCSLAV